MSAPTGWLIGNLDAEAELARAAAPHGNEPRGLPEALHQQLAAAASLMRAFAREGDRLWTARPVSAERLARDIDLPLPELVRGPVPAGVTSLPWCPTPSVPAAGSGAGRRLEPGALLHERLWQAPRAPASVLARVAHRAFCVDVARRVGLARPGVCCVRSWEQLHAHLEAGGAQASPHGRWVLKPPYSAAGRGHVLGGPGSLADEPLRRRVERLLAACGELLFEPWLERVDDWGVCGLVTDHGVDVVGLHGLRVDDRGRFRGIDVIPADGATPELSTQERQVLEGGAALVGQQLAEQGFAGPFGVDGWRHRTRDGRIALTSLGEINPRLTFGFVARSLFERVGPALGDLAGHRVGLRFARDLGDRPADAVPLLDPGDDDGLCAWLERAQVPALRPQASA